MQIVDLMNRISGVYIPVLGKIKSSAQLWAGKPSQGMKGDIVDGSARKIHDILDISLVKYELFLQIRLVRVAEHKSRKS